MQNWNLYYITGAGFFSLKTLLQPTTITIYILTEKNLGSASSLFPQQKAGYE